MLRGSNGDRGQPAEHNCCRRGTSQVNAAFCANMISASLLSRGYFTKTATAHGKAPVVSLVDLHLQQRPAMLFSDSIGAWGQPSLSCGCCLHTCSRQAAVPVRAADFDFAKSRPGRKARIQSYARCSDATSCSCSSLHNVAVAVMQARGSYEAATCQQG